MTTYNTNNPVPSVDVRDLYDNAENLDNFSNGAALAYTDRKGVSRQSLAGIRAASSYQHLGAYGAGLVFTSYNQTFSYDPGAGAEFYAPSASVALPYTTTGAGAAEVATFRSVGDAALRSDLSSTSGGGLVVLASGDTVQEFVDYMASPIGGQAVGWAPGAHTSVPDDVNGAINNLKRSGVTGIYLTDAYIPTHRAGSMAYRKQAGGRAELLKDLSKFYPAGAKISTIPPRRVFAQVTPAAFASTGTADVYRSTNLTHDFWGTAGTEQMQAAVIDNSTGRKYLDQKLYPGTDYSCQILNSAAIGGLVVEIKQPAGMAAPTTIVVELSYPVITVPRAIYVDPVNGSDTFDGSSFEWAMKTIPAAIAKVPAVVFIRPGVYIQTNYPGAYVGGSDIAIRCVDGRASFVSLSTTFGTWALSSGSTYVSTVGGSPTPVGVVDMQHTDALGCPVILNNAGSLAACQATPGTFWYDSGPRNMYVHLIDNTAPTNALVMPFGSANTFRHSSGSAKVYLSDIDFIGGTGGAISARDAGINGVLVTERCRFIGNYNSNGADIKDIGLCIMVDCVATRNAADGFNYTAYNGVDPHFIEVGCVGFKNGTGGTNNGSTAHDVCVGLRINCDAAFNGGPGFGDVGLANTLNINCTSRTNGPTGNASGFRADGAFSKVYVDGCAAASNGGSDIEATNGATIYIRDTSGTTYAGSMGLMP